MSFKESLNKEYMLNLKRFGVGLLIAFVPFLNTIAILARFFPKKIFRHLKY